MIPRVSPLLGALLAFSISSMAIAQPATNPAGQFGGRGGGGGGQPGYPIPYRAPNVEQITEVLQRVHKYVDANTPARLINRTTGEEITDFSKPNPDAQLDRGTFQLLSYEWGVTYSGMMLASEVTGDARYKDFVAKRFQLVHDGLQVMRAPAATQPAGGGAPGAGGGPGLGAGRGGARGGRGGGFAFRSITSPGALDDAGSICAALIKARRAEVGPDMMPQIQTLIDWVHLKQFRLKDGTLARTRPQPESLWLDDLYMSVPALAQMGKLTGDRQYYDDACKQILQFSGRMFVPEQGLWMHGWTTNMDDHPAFYWARANGWAIMAMVELLEVLPEDHPQRADVLKLLRAHVKGLAKLQSGTGLWHQLLDRNDSYLETSATAIFTYCIAHSINRGWINAPAYSPVATLGWNAVTTKVNEQGGVEGTCVGSDMAFDPAYYYFRPTSVTAAHGYGPVMLAGAEMIKLVKATTLNVNMGTVQVVRPAANP